MKREEDFVARGKIMTLTLELPDALPDMLHVTREQFENEAKLALLLKLYELKRISSGIAAKILEIPRVEFIFLLKQYKIPVIDLEEGELQQDILNA